MKYLLLLLFPCFVHAAEYREVLVGSLTYHVYDPTNVSPKYSNKLNDQGLIANALIGYRLVKENDYIGYSSTTLFGGANSINEPMFGIAVSSGIVIGNSRVGGVLGVYAQDNKKFLDKDIAPLSLTPYAGWGLAPVAGIEYTYKVDVSDRTYLLFNSLLSPIIINASIGIGWKI